MFKDLEYQETHYGKEETISLYEASQLLNVPVEKCETICAGKSLGKVMWDGNVFLRTNKASFDDEFLRLTTYAEDYNIEETVLNYIKENQPTTIFRIATDLGYSREKIWRVIDDITFKDRKLYEHTIGKNDFLFYAEGDWA